MKSKGNNWRRRELVGALLIVTAVTAFVGNVVQAGVDRNQRCVENAAAISSTVGLYLQDYDEYYPPTAIWNNPTNFKNEIGAYTDDASLFRCPATGGAPYATNPTVAGKWRSDFWIQENVKMLEDSVAHPDGQKTVVYLDGHVTRGGVEQYLPSVDAACAGRLLKISTGILQYAQDYDERLPPQTNNVTFREVVYPYLRSQRVWNCPDTSKPYVLSQGFRGKNLAEIPNLSRNIFIKDAQAHKSGVITTGYLDAHAVQQGPHGTVTYLPGENLPVSPGNQSRAKLKALGLALLQYAQDYDETLPPLDSIASLRTALRPYVLSDDYFEPAIPGGTPFQLNSALGGTHLSDHASPSEVIWIKDVNNYGGRLITVGYLDGHVRRVTTP